MSGCQTPRGTSRYRVDLVPEEGGECVAVRRLDGEVAAAFLPAAVSVLVLPRRGVVPHLRGAEENGWLSGAERS